MVVRHTRTHPTHASRSQPCHQLPPARGSGRASAAAHSEYGRSGSSVRTPKALHSPFCTQKTTCCRHYPWVMQQSAASVSIRSRTFPAQLISSWPTRTPAAMGPETLTPKLWFSASPCLRFRQARHTTHIFLAFSGVAQRYIRAKMKNWFQGTELVKQAETEGAGAALHTLV